MKIKFKYFFNYSITYFSSFSTDCKNFSESIIVLHYLHSKLFNFQIIFPLIQLGHLTILKSY